MTAHADPVVSPALVESLLGITDSAVRDHMVKAVTDRFLAFTRRTVVAQAEVVELLRGDDSPSLYVHDWPLDSTETVQVEVLSAGEVVDTLTLADSEIQVFAGHGEVIRLSGVWPLSDGERNLRVTYTGGWATVPGDIEHAAIEQIIADYRRYDKEGAGVTNVSMNSESIGYEKEGLIQSVADAWGRYRNL